MRQLYPALGPNRHGMLDVGDGQSIYWEECGNPIGKPVVFLHGGPGAGCSPVHRQLFDPAQYRVVLLDQRNCGRSKPHASDPAVDLSTNTTWHLVEDLEQLREHLSIDRWQVFGGSWGSALALAYAQTHPARVTELVLRGIFTLRTSEIDWFYEGGAANLLPDLWEKYIKPLPEQSQQRGKYVETFSRLLAHRDPSVHLPAAVAWATWEAASVTLLPRTDLIERYADPTYALALARIENHYFTHGGWFNDAQLIRDAVSLSEIPTVIVQGRYDLCTPAVTAWDLHRALPSATFHMIDDAGHAFDEPGILDALIATTDRLADGDAGRSGAW